MKAAAVKYTQSFSVTVQHEGRELHLCKPDQVGPMKNSC